MRTPRSFVPSLLAVEPRVLPSGASSHVVRTAIVETSASVPRSVIPTPKDLAYVQRDGVIVLTPWLQLHEQNLAVIRQSGPRQGTVLFGDSILALWPDNAPDSWEAAFRSRAANFGIMGDLTENLLWRLENGELDGRPRVAIVEVGINNLLRGDSAEDTSAGIMEVARTIHRESPGTRVLLLSLLPSGPDDVREAARQVNATLASSQRQGHYQFVDLAALGIDQGKPGGDAYFKDLVHPSARGYQLMARAIRARLAPDRGSS
jgi:beta-glucosidase